MRKQLEKMWRLKDRRNPVVKKVGAQAPRPNRSLRLWTSWLLKESIRCYHVFRRSTSKTAGQPLLAVEWLVAQLKETAKKAQVLDLSEVWWYYCELAQTAEEEISGSSHFSAGESHLKTNFSRRYVTGMTVSFSNNHSFSNDRQSAWT